ncbi:hypothetical protein DSUL_50441 [Desulfovibrionales bacterium]
MVFSNPVRERSVLKNILGVLDVTIGIIKKHKNPTFFVSEPSGKRTRTGQTVMHYD